MLWVIMDIKNEEDRNLVEEIYIKYECHMYYIALNILKDKLDAQDCVHETIARIIDYLDKYKTAKQQGYLEKLISIACRNCAFNKYEKKKRRRRYEMSTSISDNDSELYGIVDIPDDSALVDKIVISEHNYNLLKEIIGKLDPKYRDIITLRSMGFSNGQIANLIGISIELVRKRLSRARKEIIKMGGDELDYE